jgi:hypothetical protein
MAFITTVCKQIHISFRYFLLTNRLIYFFPNTLLKLDTQYIECYITKIHADRTKHFGGLLVDKLWTAWFRSLSCTNISWMRSDFIWSN